MIEDRSLCTFYSRIGACRHGDKCSRKHLRPQSSKTVLLANLYPNPKTDRNSDKSASERSIAESFEHFYIDVYKRLAQAGEIESMLVCENENFHLNGNVYVKFTSTKAASDAVMSINQEWFAGKPVYCELSPVQSFYEAKCRAHDTNTCNRGDNCNFMHVKKISNDIPRKLRLSQDKSIALKRLRELFGDEKWGEEWAGPTKEKYERNKKPKTKASTNNAQAKSVSDQVSEEENEGDKKQVNGDEKEENGKTEDNKVEAAEGDENAKPPSEAGKAQVEAKEGEESSEEEPVSTAEAVARLFA